MSTVKTNERKGSVKKWRGLPLHEARKKLTLNYLLNKRGRCPWIDKRLGWIEQRNKRRFMLINDWMRNVKYLNLYEFQSHWWQNTFLQNSFYAVSLEFCDCEVVSYNVLWLQDSHTRYNLDFLFVGLDIYLFWMWIFPISIYYGSLLFFDSLVYFKF